MSAPSSTTPSSTPRGGRHDSRFIGEHQQQQQREEFRTALRALLMTPLMAADDAHFPAVRRQSEALRDWFAREAGWMLQVERDGARLYKRPADLADATRGLPGYDRHRYVLLCLACAVLERADAQITLRLLGERLIALAAEPTLQARGFSFALTAQGERRDLVAVCRTLLGLGVLQRVAGDEDAFVQTTAEQAGELADALYDVQRRALAGMLAAVRGPSTWAPEQAPVSLDERLQALANDHRGQDGSGDDSRRTALRHHLARRLLDDPVVYVDTLPDDARAYFINQRGVLAARLCDATGLDAEQRAEGLALVDDGGELTDVTMPAEGTDAHATLLVAEHLAAALRKPRAAPGDAVPVTRDEDIAAHLRNARDRFGRYWRKSAREAGAERELAAVALDRLEKLQLVTRDAGTVRALPALARFALGDTDVQPTPAQRRKAAAAADVLSGSLFE